MKSVRRKIKILDNQSVNFIWGGNTHINDYGWREAGLLYDPTYTQAKLKLLQLSDFKDDKMFKVLLKVQKAFEEPANASSVECVMTFDYSSKKHAMSARACFDEKLVKTLSNLLTEPKISVTGTFNGLTRPSNYEGK
ncbi:hypothetical protein Ocin01_17970 [Orchesella cincta]|uniref:Uncharacterized protein n=1 Tax=Orchesella cincta TaxID=48709 RepID=A0A1D2M6W7_ORCCI|nr:hypothetical protein Ocin01_17970 [Orchesella cincta]